MVPNFIQTKDDIIWFTFNKIDNNFLCFPKKIGKYKGKKYSEWFNKPIDILSKYKKKIDGLDEKVYIVNQKQIKKVYDPLKFVEDKKYLNLKFNLDYYVEYIVKSINDFFDIELSSIGIEGSILLECYKESSDIDILVYGKENAKKIQNKFDKFNKYKGITLFNEEQANEYVEKRKECGYGNNIEIMKKQFFRRYYGFVFGKQFSVVCVPYEFGDGYINLNRKIKYIDTYEGILKITNDDNSCLIPSRYIAKDINNKEYKIEVYNHYGINQAKNNELVFVKGKKYKDIKENDEIIILSFWSNIEERFDLYE